MSDEGDYEQDRDDWLQAQTDIGTEIGEHDDRQP